MMRKLYVLRHKTRDTYLKSKTGGLTNLKGEALRAGSPEEAEAFKIHVTIPIAWEVIEVDYDTLKGKVVS